MLCVKKLILTICALALALTISACGRTLEDIIQNEPSIVGVVTEVSDDHFILLGVPMDGAPTDEYSVSLDVEYKDSYTSVAVGDEVVVYYNGKFTDSDPEIMDVVYAITLKTPAERETG